MKTKEELENIKIECKIIATKLMELDAEELEQVTGVTTWGNEQEYDEAGVEIVHRKCF